MRTRYGQNFLVDPNIARKIVDAADIGHDDTVVEIGPGRGALTGLIAERAARTIAVELDPALAGELSRKFPRVETIAADALKTDFETLAHNRKIIAIGNLPYYVSTAILGKIISGHCWKRAIFMFQKEVARRIAALAGAGGGTQTSPKDYGYLSITTRYYSVPQFLFDVRPGSFKPMPKVTSSVISFAPQNEAVRFKDSKTEKLFFRIIEAAFSQRRKTILNSLARLACGDKEKTRKILVGAGISDGIRPEKIPPEDFKKLALAFAREHIA